MTENEVIEILENDTPDTSDAWCSALDMSISALKEIQQYRAIGTVKECKKAIEKEKPIKPTFQHMINDTKFKTLCSCGNLFTADIDSRKNKMYCEMCGQKLDWGE